MGSSTPIVVQSMTNTDTADAARTAEQVVALARAGSQLVRVTVNNEEAAAAVPEIAQRVADAGVVVPIVGDFHYNGHLLLAKYPGLRPRAGQVPHQPRQRRRQAARREFPHDRRRSPSSNDKPVRIGVNWGSLDQDLLTQMMDENARAGRAARREGRLHRGDARAARSDPRSSRRRSACGTTRSSSRRRCRGVPDLVDVYERLAARCDYPLHLGLTEAGMGMKGMVASAAALSILLAEGIGDTIRVSLTPKPNGDRTEEVLVAQQILQSLGLRSFAPQVTACPGCGRTTSTFFQHMAEDIQTYMREQMPVWREQHPGVER